MVGGGQSAVNTVTNIASALGPVGVIAAGVIQGVNALGSSNLRDFSLDKRVQQSSSYTGSATDIGKTHDKYAGGGIDAFSTMFGLKSKYNQ
jgi:hypothetical protein